MQIHLATSTGIGSTKLAAFDAALNNAGIANYNLLLLSSVVPPGSELIRHESTIPAGTLPGAWGDRLYVVMAQQRADVAGDEVWAGIGWVQDPETGKGLFVEHEGTSEAEVRSDVQASLTDLMKTRGVDFGEIHMAVQGTRCEGEPVCAMAVAAYQVSDWQNAAQHLGV